MYSILKILKMKKSIYYPVLVFIMFIGLIASCKKDKTKPVVVSNISVKTAPTKASYYVREALDLSGMVVNLTMSHGVAEDVAFSDFESKGITCSPQNGTTLTTTSKFLTITHTATGDSVKLPILKTVTDIDNNNYSIVKIGNQIWMAENLKTTHYSNGTTIPLVTGVSNWSALTDNSKAYCWYNDDMATNFNTYGALYTWAAAMNGSASTENNPSGVQGVCPSGWHLPSEREWNELTDYLENNGYNYDGTTTSQKIASSMASDANWESSTTEGAIGNNAYPAYINKSGFTAQPAGYRLSDGNCSYKGHSAGFSCTLGLFTTPSKVLNSGGHYISVESFKKNVGLSVRCLKDL
jgi:uncharacterized protein (TIGR02145 family)